MDQGSDESKPAPHSAATGPSEILALIDAVQDYAIFLLGPDGEIRSWNRGAERVMGYSASEAIGKNFRIFYGEDDLAARKPEEELQIAAAEGRVENEGWRIRKDGVRFWANTIITPSRDASGAVIGFAKVTRDLTAHRAADERLRQSEEMFRLLVESVKDYAIFMLDANGNVATWNEGAHRIKGYEASEIIGRHFSTFYPEEDVRNGEPQRKLEIARERGSVEDEGWRIRKNGTRFWALVVITAVFDEKGTLRGYAKVTRDITERKRAEEVQRALLEQREARLQAEEEQRRAEASYRVAQESNRAKDEFLMTLSHELRTPMTAILGWSRLLPTLPPDDAAFSDAITSIARSAQLQARLIDDVLDVSRIVSGKLRLSVEKIEVAPLLNSAIEGVRASADSKMITIATNFGPALGAVVADPTRLQQIVWNLLTNAVKFTPRNGTITVGGKRTTSRLEISVSDSGEGIDPGFLPHVFEPFRQAESPNTRVHGGLGLGLSIVRYIAEAHGGSVNAQSAGRGRGSTFTVILPIAAVAIEPEKIEKEPARELHTTSRRLDGMKVLVVDDDRDSRNVVRMVLQQAGATAIAVDSAQAALRELESLKPDVIVTDIAMPGMDGYALAREVRRRANLNEVRLLALSAFPSAKVAAHENAFDGYLMKPVDPAELVEAAARTPPAA